MYCTTLTFVLILTTAKGKSKRPSRESGKENAPPPSKKRKGKEGEIITIAEHTEATPTDTTTHKQKQPDKETTAGTIASSDDSFSSFDDVYSDLDPDATLSPLKPRLTTENTMGSTDSLLLEMEVQYLSDKVNSVEHTQLKILQVQESILASMKQVFWRLSDLERG